MGWYLCGRLKGFYQVGRELDRGFTTKENERSVSLDHSFAPILCLILFYISKLISQHVRCANETGKSLRRRQIGEGRLLYREKQITIYRLVIK